LFDQDRNRLSLRRVRDGIAVPSLDKVPLIIDILITAVRNGELDEQLAQTKKPGRSKCSVQQEKPSLTLPLP
jgi:hypothetical protein